MSSQGRIVVTGVDEGMASVTALAFALDEGLAHGYAVEVVTAWLWTSPFEGMERVSTVAEGDHVAAALQNRALHRALSGREERPTISRTVVHGDARQVLVERAEGAHMLVVGSGRKGALARFALGSVSEYCVRHAPTAVVVVPDPGRLEHPAPAAVEPIGAIT
jgi:nucleotide-binding universal stress UspA family protein